MENKADDLTIAPGKADFAFGSVLSMMIAYAFNRCETLDPDTPHKFYTECRQCGGTDKGRKIGVRSALDLVKHEPGCAMAKSLPRLRAMANKDVT